MMISFFSLPNVSIVNFLLLKLIIDNLLELNVSLSLFLSLLSLSVCLSLSFRRLQKTKKRSELVVNQIDYTIIIKMTHETVTID